MSDPGYADDATDTSAEDEAANAIAQRRAMDFMVRKAAQAKAVANPALAVRPALAPGAAPAGPLVNALGRPTPRPAMPQDPASLAVRPAMPPAPDTGADAYYKYLSDIEKTRQDAVTAAYAPQVKYWEDARARLEAKRSGPTAVERLSQLSAAFFKPTQYSGFGATMGNVLPVLAEQEKAKREDASQQADLLEKYQQGSMETGTKKALELIPKDKSAAILAYMTKMGKAGKGPGIVVDPLRGTARRKDTGAEIMTANPADVKDLIDFVNQGRGAEASLKFDTTYGPGAAELYITAAQGAEYGGY